MRRKRIYGRKRIQRSPLRVDDKKKHDYGKVVKDEIDRKNKVGLKYMKDWVEDLPRIEEEERMQRIKEKEFWQPDYKYKKLKHGEGHDWDTDA